MLAILRFIVDYDLLVALDLKWCEKIFLKIDHFFEFESD